jgi:Holliday junction resolvase RusA-like endonuclease
MIRGGKPVNVPSGSNANRDAQQSWDACVRSAAIEAVRRAMKVDMVSGVFFSERPLRLEIEFRMRRRKADFDKKTGVMKFGIPKFHIVKPDLSKLIRCTEDAMTGIVFLDDAQVAELLARKVYAAPGSEGAWIRITELIP